MTRGTSFIIVKLPSETLMGEDYYFRNDKEKEKILPTNMLKESDDSPLIQITDFFKTETETPESVYICIMRKTAILLLALIGTLSCGKRNKPQIIKFELYSTSEHCKGDAPPSEELLKELNTPKPYNDTIYIHQDPGRMDEGVAVILKNGKAKVQGLAEGPYMIFRFPKSKLDALSKKHSPEVGCYRHFYTMRMMDFQVHRNTSIIKDTFILRCDPCVTKHHRPELDHPQGDSNFIPPPNLHIPPDLEHPPTDKAPVLEPAD